MMNTIYLEIMFCLYSMMVINMNGGMTTTRKEGIRSTPRRKEDRANNSIEFEVTEEEVLAAVGETAKLRCSVKNLGDNVVSWIRQKKLTILTSGLMPFTGDSRFEVDHPSDDSNSWDLILHDVQKTDAGIYECQINTEPKLKRSTYLIVSSGNGDTDFSFGDDVETLELLSSQTASIVGPSEEYVEVGSTVTIMCDIRSNNTNTFSSRFLKYCKPVHWFYYSTLLNIRSRRGGISIDTIKSANSTVSHLTMAFVTQQDSGNYTCKPMNGQSDGIVLHVLKTEEMEAVKLENYLQSNYASSAAADYNSICNSWLNRTIVVSFLLLVYSTLFTRFPHNSIFVLQLCVCACIGLFYFTNIRFLIRRLYTKAILH